MRHRTCFLFLAAAMLLPWTVIRAEQPTPLEPNSAAPAPAPKPIAERLADRGFPSVFQAWSPADNLHDEDRWTTFARHDLAFVDAALFLGMKWKGESRGLGEEFTPEGVQAGRRNRDKIRSLNPNQVILSEIRYRDASQYFLPAEHPWWKRTPDGKRMAGWAEGGYFLLDFHNPEYREHVARQCRAVVETGAVEGVMLDWWQDDDDHVELIKAIRQAVGEQALILANGNDRQFPRTAQYINGTFMECYRSKTDEDWKRIEGALTWAEKALREPRINCLETWYAKSRQDLDRMRATTTMSLTMSDGYCLFSDPNQLPTPDHLHDWYPFWNKSLGKPLCKGAQRSDGAWQREFENGTAVYNPVYNQKIKVSFEEERNSAASGIRAREFEIAPMDGDLLLRK